MRSYTVKENYIDFARGNKTGQNCLKYDATSDFSVGLRTGSNPKDINQSGSHTRKVKKKT